MQLRYKLNVGIFYYLIIILFTINNIINLNLVCICLFVYSFFYINANKFTVLIIEENIVITNLTEFQVM